MKRLFKLFRVAVAVMTTALGFSGCADTVDDYYADLSASFRYNAVFTTAPLLSALSNPGQFCTIKYSNNRYVFADASGNTAYANTTAVTAYGKPVYVCGFIVGQPAVPDLTGTTVCAYDLACPNCYEQYYINKELAFASSTTMRCPRCSRVYDLNNSGNVQSDGGGRALFRYHVTYSSATGAVYIYN